MGRTIRITIDGIDYACRDDQTLAAFMLGAGLHMRVSVSGEPRAGFCGMGYCGECRVKTPSGVVLACLQPCVEGLVVTRHG